MTFEQAIKLVRDHDGDFTKVRRRVWDSQLALNYFTHYRCDGNGDLLERALTMWDLDNGEGSTSGAYWIFKPTNEDMVATDWEVYDAARLFSDDEWDALVD
jgi:hypothetical protein